MIITRIIWKLNLAYIQSLVEIFIKNDIEETLSLIRKPIYEDMQDSKICDNRNALEKRNLESKCSFK